jgi:hypothetical protein
LSILDSKLLRAENILVASKTNLSKMRLGEDLEPSEELKELLLSYHHNIFSTILAIREILNDLSGGSMPLEILEILKEKEQRN